MHTRFQSMRDHFAGNQRKKLTAYLEVQRKLKRQSDSLSISLICPIRLPPVLTLFQFRSDLNYIVIRGNHIILNWQGVVGKPSLKCAIRLLQLPANRALGSGVRKRQCCMVLLLGQCLRPRYSASQCGDLRTRL
jgi:hypothetical protein